MLKRLIFIVICFPYFLWSAPLLTVTKINDIQLLATHNSFKRYLDPFILSLINSVCTLKDLSLDDYQHLPLTRQLDLGVRGVEIDIFADPEGGKFRKFFVLSLLGEDGESHDPDLDKPGFKVMHDVNFDFHASCHLFVGCLSEMKAWSDGHPNHLPIFVHVQVRDEPTPGIGQYLRIIGLPEPLVMTKKLLDDLDIEIKTIIPVHQIITPGEVRGKHATLREAVLANAWPTIEESRGKFIFYMDARPYVQALYLEEHPQSSERVIFTSPSNSNAEDAAFLILNGPKEHGQKIKDLVSEGFIVRTRADSGTIEAYANDKTTWKAALDSGAQIVSTDFIVPEPKTGTGYYVFIPNGHPVRCSPLRESFCDARAIGE
jgi:Phosphoinositide phospholipase C, Ca2+-dependent